MNEPTRTRILQFDGDGPTGGLRRNVVSYQLALDLMLSSITGQNGSDIFSSLLLTSI